VQPELGIERAAGDMLAAALSYSERGWPVFPVNGKTPLTEHGFHDASRDPEQIRAWWAAHPAAGVAVATGEPSGLLVVDIDAQKGGATAWKRLCGERGKVPKTLATLTGGGGSHLLFRYPGDVPSSTSRLAEHVDVKAAGGYVVFPPSVHPNGRAYKWMNPKTAVAEPPAWLVELTRGRPSTPTTPSVAEIIPEGQRRAAMLTVAGRLKRAGLTGAEILPTLRELNRRCRPPLDEAELQSVALKSTLDADPETSIAAIPEATPRPIESVLDVFRGWMHMPDPGLLYAVCAGIAVNRVAAFDPTWIIYVGAAGSGKSETLAATSRLPGVHVVGTLTEASLLSGTPRKDAATDASGGLLRELGESGTLILKDLGSILSMHRDARAAVLAALRELFDGSWTRLVGVDGGRRLHWEGRLGLLAGATSVLDQHHGMMAQLGERFLIYRVDVADPAEQARSSLAHHGRERIMRQELGEAVAGLFAGLDHAEPSPLTATDTDRLIALATLVARARSPVVRDPYRRELELVPDSEAPGRIVGALGRLLTGLRLIGVADDEAWRVTVKTGLDSMPAVRLRAFLLMLSRDSDVSTTDVATALDLPNPTTHRTLEELAAHGVIARKSQGQGKADLWRVRRWARSLHRAATSSEMSDAPIFPFTKPKTIYDDISEEVGS
jgi:bifunctional DNA primase/polymerase-like protein/primase-like protein/IclR-like helix-turn-helix domain-containing protein